MSIDWQLMTKKEKVRTVLGSVFAGVALSAMIGVGFLDRGSDFRFYFFMAFLASVCGLMAAGNIR